MSKGDSKRILRQWDREIDAEIRRAAARDRIDGPWRAVTWTALWVVWLLLLFGLILHVKALG